MMKKIKYCLLSLFALIGIAAHAQQVEITMSNGSVQTFDADEVVYGPETAPTFYYGMADNDIEDLYVNGDVFTLPAGYIETSESEFTLTNAIFDSSLYSRCRSWYVVVPSGTNFTMIESGGTLNSAALKKSYTYTDELGDKYDVYLMKSLGEYTDYWSLNVTIDKKPVIYYGMADGDLVERNVSDGVFSLPDGYKLTEAKVINMSKSRAFDSKLYADCRSWYMVVPKGSDASFVEEGSDVPYYNSGYEYTDAYGNEYDVYMRIYDATIQTDWTLKASIEGKPAFYYGMADRDIEDLYVNGDQFTLPAGYRETANGEFTLTNAIYDETLYSRCRSWYVVVSNGTSVSFKSSGLNVVIDKKNYSYTDEFGDKYDVYLEKSVGELPDTYRLEVTINDTPTYYYGLSGSDLEANYVHDGVFSLPESYIETYRPSFTLTNEIRDRGNGTYADMPHSWYVLVPAGSNVDFDDSSMPPSYNHPKSSYVFYDAVGKVYDVYFVKWKATFLNNWRMRVKVTLPESN